MPSSLLHYALLLVLPTTIFFHLIRAPYTKVEESFNIQAIHDIVTHGIPVRDTAERLQTHFDHSSFPGAVPRTFVGALSVASVSWPFVGWLTDPEHAQLLVRGVVGLFNSLALIAFHDAVSQSFGRVAGYWYIIFQSSQFHVMYYASRTLPNMYAFGLCTVALRFLMLSHFGSRPERAQRIRAGLALFTVSGIIFRSEIALLLACQTLWLLMIRRVSLRRVIMPAGIAAMTAGLLTTVSVDSFFWQKFPIWPEWIAFRYNTIEGRSSEWGTSPWYFYAANAMPRLMLNPLTYLLCIPTALADRLTRRFCLENLLPLLGFVGIYSFLPHKEWRFIIYVIPTLTAVASAGAAYIWNRRSRSWLFSLLSLALITSVIASFLTSAGLLYISTLNYPGAIGLQRLHALADSERPLIRVHLDSFACQTGVTRFLQIKAPEVSNAGWENQTVWHYDKTEDEEVRATAAFWERFDYALEEDPSRVVGQWTSLEAVEGFAGIGMLREAGLTERKASMTTNEASIDYLVRMWYSFEDFIKRRLTWGRWPYVRMEPKLYIMKKEDR